MVETLTQGPPRHTNQRARILSGQEVRANHSTDAEYRSMPWGQYHRLAFAVGLCIWEDVAGRRKFNYYELLRAHVLYPNTQNGIWHHNQTLLLTKINDYYSQ